MRRKDCFEPYPNLRRLANTPGGFAAAPPLAYRQWSQAERDYYDRQVLPKAGRIPPLL